MEISRFFKEVKSEALKVTWPNRREALISAAMVVVMASLAGFFFLFVDAIVNKVISFILGI